MPIYEFFCKSCSKKLSVYKPLSQASDEQRCVDCGHVVERIYSFSLKKEFFAYDDAQYGCNISSYKQERRLMKKHKHVYTADTAFYQDKRWKNVRKLAKKKPTHFTPAGVSKMDRD